MNIKELLIDKIKNNGSINVSEFIQICQFENNGYYIKNNPIGKSNDFITSPEISQMFGEILGIFLINYWEKKIKNNPLTLPNKYFLGLFLKYKNKIKKRIIPSKNAS